MVTRRARPGALIEFGPVSGGEIAGLRVRYPLARDLISWPAHHFDCDMSAPSLSTGHQSAHDDPEMPNVGSRVNPGPRRRASPPLQQSFLGSRDGQALRGTLSTVVESAMHILGPVALYLKNYVENYK